MKNLNIRSILTALFSIAFAAVLGLSAVREASAQRYLTQIKSAAEVRGISQFGDDLSAFLELAESLEGNKRITPVQLTRLDRTGKKVKDGAGTFKNNLKNLIAKLKNSQHWDDQLDKEINETLGNRRIRAFFQRNGGRNLLTAGETAANSISRDVDTIISNIKNQQAGNASGGDSVFAKTAFAPNASAKKFKFKCAVLGVAIFGAELLGADRTAENLDGIFDKNCGSGATPTS